MNEASFRLRNVSRLLGDAFRLSIDDLTMPSGKTFVLLGPTGAGKTTLLRLLTGVERPDGGVVQFSGSSLNQQSPLSLLRRIAMVHQRPILLNTSVASNVAFGLHIRGSHDDPSVADMMRRLGLDRLVRQNARRLSGGQTQLVALARALATEPDALLLDEPSANLDPAYVALVEDVIAEAQAARGMTVVWATHNLFQARRVGATVALLLDGRIVEVADASTFFERPTDPALPTSSKEKWRTDD